MTRWMWIAPQILALVLAVPVIGAAEEGDEGEQAGAAGETDAGEAAETPDDGSPAGEPAASEAAAGGGTEAALADASTMSWEQAWDTGFALYREGRHADAIPYLERALSLEGDDPTVRAYLAECFRRTGDEARAAALLPPPVPAAAEDDGDDEDDGDEEDDEDDEDDDVECDGCDDDHHGLHALRSTRRGRHFGFGVAVLNNAVSLGLYVEVLPVHFLAIQGGIGAGDTHTRFWWAQVAAAPIDGPLTPTVGIGVSGNFGLDFHFADYLLLGRGYYLARINPYAHAGITLVTRFGFTAAFEISAVVTGDPTFPVAPRAGFRLGLLL